MAKVTFGQGNGWIIKTKLILLLVAMIMPIAGWGWGGETSSLTGQWESSEASSAPRGFPDKIELLKDGTGLGGGQGLKWSAENGRLIFRFDSGQGVAYAYQISGSTLILTDDDGKSVRYMAPEKAKAAKEEAAQKTAEAKPFKADKSQAFGVWELELEAKTLKALDLKDSMRIFVESSEKSIDIHIIAFDSGVLRTKSDNQKRDIWWIFRGDDLYLKIDGVADDEEFPVQFLDDKTVRLDIGKLDSKLPSNIPRNIILKRSSPTELAAAPEAIQKAAEEEMAAVKAAAEEAARVGNPTLFAPTQGAMKWNDAKAYCTSQGGRLPRVGGKDNFPGMYHPEGTPIDGFGAVGAKWPSGLNYNNGAYWTDTKNGTSAMLVVDRFDKSVSLHSAYTADGIANAVCVP